MLYEGVEIIDFTGPFEVLMAARMKVFTMSPDGNLLSTNMGLQVKPDYGLSTCPPFDVLLVPGGDIGEIGKSGILGDTAAMNWVKTKAGEAKYVMSVCNGAFILAHNGLLDGLEVTTYWRAIPDLDSLLPNAAVVSDKRFTDNGKIITTAGLTSGMDGAFHLVEKLLGKGQAQTTALNLEYNWQPDANFARAALADRHMHFWLSDEGQAETLSREGTRDEWESRWHVWELSAQSLFDSVNQSIAEQKVWTKPHVRWQKSKKQPELPYHSHWEFQDENGAWWDGIVSITETLGKKDDSTLSIRVSKRKS